MRDATAVIILRQGTDVERALGLLEPMGLAQIDAQLVEQALRAVHPDPLIPEVYAVTGPRTDGDGMAEMDLTPRERDMLQLVARGMSNQEIAEHLYLSQNSVKSYIRHAYRKIGVNSRARAVIWWFENQAPARSTRRAIGR